VLDRVVFPPNSAACKEKGWEEEKEKGNDLLRCVKYGFRHDHRHIQRVKKGRGEEHDQISTSPSSFLTVTGKKERGGLSNFTLLSPSFSRCSWSRREGIISLSTLRWDEWGGRGEKRDDRG